MLEPAGCGQDDAAWVIFVGVINFEIEVVIVALLRLDVCIGLLAFTDVLDELLRHLCCLPTLILHDQLPSSHERLLFE